MPISARTKLPPPDSADEFEDLVTEALRARHSNPRLNRLGRSGQRQYGIDGWDSVDPRGLVWQATARKARLFEKLVDDLARFDAVVDLAARSTFIYAMAQPRDAALQAKIMRLCQERLDAGKCSVEALFWEDVSGWLPKNIVQRHYPEWTPPLGEPRVVSIAQGLLALGGRVVAEASLMEQRSDVWTMKLGAFTIGSLAELARLIEEFAVGSGSDWMAFEGLGTARWLESAPRLRGDELTLTVAALPERMSVHEVPSDIELSDEFDAYPDFREVSGFRAALQAIQIAMSTPLGSFISPEDGTRCADYFGAHDARTLGRLFALELARLAFVPTRREQPRPGLPFIDRVMRIEIPSLKLEGEMLSAIAQLEIHGHGEWLGPLRFHLERADPAATEQAIADLLANARRI